MKEFILFFMFICTIISCNNHPNGEQCKQVKNGHFEFVLKTKTGKIPFDIYRTNETQIEVAKNTLDTSVYKVKWINDCNYELLLSSCNYKLPALKLQELQSNALQTTITKVDNQFYIFRAMRNQTTLDMTDTFFVAK